MLRLLAVLCFLTLGTLAAAEPAPDAVAQPAAKADEAPAPVATRYPIAALGERATVNHTLNGVVLRGVTLSRGALDPQRKARVWVVRASLRNAMQQPLLAKAALLLYRQAKELGGLVLLDGTTRMDADAILSVEKRVELPPTVTPDTFGVLEELPAPAGGEGAGTGAGAGAAGTAGTGGTAGTAPSKAEAAPNGASAAPRPVPPALAAALEEALSRDVKMQVLLTLQNVLMEDLRAGGPTARPASGPKEQTWRSGQAVNLMPVTNTSSALRVVVRSPFSITFPASAFETIRHSRNKTMLGRNLNAFFRVNGNIVLEVTAPGTVRIGGADVPVAAGTLIARGQNGAWVIGR